MRTITTIHRLASLTIVLLLFGLKLPAFGVPLDPELGATEIVEKMVLQEETNNVLARKYGYELVTVTEKLDDDGNVVKSTNKTSKQRMQPEISYKVKATKGGKETDTEVAIGGGGVAAKGQTEESDEAGTYLEAMTIRELSRYYDFERGADEELDGSPHYILNFKPKNEKDIPKANSREQKVLAHLAGKIWINPADFALVKSDSNLVSPLPFLIIDLVSLRKLHIAYEAFKLEDRVWLPKQMEVTYEVRVLYFQMIRERQKSAMKNYALANDSKANKP